MSYLPKKQSIGVFDSGFGGLDILKGIVKELPEYNYVYLGDTARSPYGNRSPEIVYEFTRQAIDFLFRHHCSLIILACNTASSDALRKIQTEYLPHTYPGKQVLGVLIPGAEEATVYTRNQRIGVIATEGTVASGAFIRELTKLNPATKVFQQACPLLVPLIETGEHNSTIIEPILEQYLRPLLNEKIDTLILGCTHYGILKHHIRKIAGSDLHIISEATVVPEKLRFYLKKHAEQEALLGKESTLQFYSTDPTEKFTFLGSQFFGSTIHPLPATLQ
ncbi:MAG: glutamate racemase [Candidatus Moranbacteria bacterium]|jgi:glutamate racemase|nr:glutamate racemase [Candidatus Moranbacteria bacterium]MBP9801514.1 glutamate racemase [Candidatus Moranbacteria bacterium]